MTFSLQAHERKLKRAAIQDICKHDLHNWRLQNATAQAAGRGLLQGGAFGDQPKLSPIRVLNQVVIWRKLPLLTLADSMAVAPTVLPPLAASTILRLAPSY